MPTSVISSDSVRITATTGNVQVSNPSGVTTLTDPVNAQDTLQVDGLSTFNASTTHATGAAANFQGGTIFSSSANTLTVQSSVDLGISQLGLNTPLQGGITIGSPASEITVADPTNFSGSVDIQTGDLNVATGDITVPVGNLQVFAGELFTGDMEIRGDIGSGLIRQAVGDLSIETSAGAGDIVLSPAPNNDIRINPTGSGSLNMDNNNISTIGGVEVRQQAADPVLADISNEHWAVFENTTSGDQFLTTRTTTNGLTNYLLSQIAVTSGATGATVVDVGAGATYTIGVTNSDRYTRFADRVDFALDFQNVSTVGVPSGALQIQGLPVFGGITDRVPVNVRIVNAGGTAFYWVQGEVLPGGNIEFYVQQNLDATMNTLIQSETLTNARIIVSGTYFVN